MNLLMLLAVLGSGTEAVTDGTVLVDVTGFEDNSGQAVIVLLTEEEMEFPPNPDGAAITFRANIENLAVHLEIPAVPSGRYVAMAYHDSNENGRFDMEDEPVGVSGELPQMQSQGSRPDFDDISFAHEGAVSSARITVRKMERPQGGPPGGGGPGGGGPGGGMPR